MLDGDQVVVIVPVKRAAGGRRVLGLPKGHPDGDETPEQAARREVRRGGGRHGELIEELGDVHYRVRAARAGGSPRRVRFFLYRYHRATLADHDHEIEEARWMPLEQAARELAYQGSARWSGAPMSRGIADR